LRIGTTEKGDDVSKDGLSDFGLRGVSEAEAGDIDQAEVRRGEQLIDEMRAEGEAAGNGQCLAFEFALDGEEEGVPDGGAEIPVRIDQELIAFD
jgi:hypothetical protein